VRILYGIFGYGRGHATRALAVLPELRSRHDVTIVAGGDAYDAVSPHHPVVRIPTLRYEYGNRGRRSLSRTFGENVRLVSDIVFCGPSMAGLERLVRDVRPDVIISDADPWTHTLAARRGIPRISFDHFGILAYCRPPIAVADRLRSMRDVLAYRGLMGRPDRVIVSSFYDGGARDPHIRFVGTLLREEVLSAKPARGDYLLAYFNRGDHQLSPRIESAMHALGVPVVVYGTTRQGDDRNLTFRPPSNRPFIEDLARCRAVFSTAGNQLVGEAMWLGKPMLVMPEHTVEQRLNAAAVERIGIGMQVHHEAVTSDTFRRFLADEVPFREAAVLGARDGRVEAIAALEGFARELTVRGARTASSAWRYA
jgi:uncharacterized protein (TIGR00661 family)